MDFREYQEQSVRQDVYVNEEGLNRYIAKVFGWTFVGLLVTALTVAFFIIGAAVSPAIANFVIAAMDIMLFIWIGQMVLIFALCRKIERLNPVTAVLMYLFYAASMGVLFTWVTLTTEIGDLFLAFGLTAVSFGTMAVYGLVTKKDLTKMGNMLFFALIGLVIAIVVNLFLGSAPLTFVISIAGLFIFLGLTIYDTNRIKSFYYYSQEQSDNPALASNLAVYSALGLYLNFINIFLFILRLIRD